MKKLLVALVLTFSMVLVGCEDYGTTDQRQGQQDQEQRGDGFFGDTFNGEASDTSFVLINLENGEAVSARIVQRSEVESRANQESAQQQTQSGQSGGVTGTAESTSADTSQLDDQADQQNVDELFVAVLADSVDGFQDYNVLRSNELSDFLNLDEEGNGEFQNNDQENQQN